MGSVSDEVGAVLSQSEIERMESDRIVTRDP